MGTSDLASTEWLTLCEGSRIDGRFVLQRLVEHSETHAIYDAFDEVVARPVQIRLMPRPSLPDPRLRHPNLVVYQDRGCVGAWYAGVLDSGEGRPLADCLHRMGALPAEVAVAVAADVLEGLDFAHTHGMVHGSLSIHGLHVTPTWHARIVGFPEGFGPLSTDAKALAAPERWTGNRGDERSDVYAVGLLVFQMITGRPAFGEGAAARHGHFLESLPRDATVPPELFEVLRIATDKRPALRYPTAGAFMAALLGVFKKRPVSTPGLVLDSTQSTELPPQVEEWIGTGETLDPAPRRREDVRSGAPVLPALMLASMSLLALGVASLAVLAALGVWALSNPSSTIAASQASGTEALAVSGPVQHPTRTVVVPTQPGWFGEAGSTTVEVPVRFGYDSYEAQRTRGFNGFVDAVKARPGTVRLTGHTDDRGAASANHIMGLGRAWSASLLMVADGVREGRIELASAGETQPIAPNDTAAGRAKNRRVTADLEPTLGEIVDSEAR